MNSNNNSPNFNSVIFKERERERKKERDRPTNNECLMNTPCPSALAAIKFCTED